MKFSIILATLFSVVACCSPKNYSNENEFIHGTYTVARRMKADTYITPQNYEEFQFVYFFAQPIWQVADFDKSQEWINDKYVTNWEYANQEGCQYVDEFIVNVHKNKDAKILLSFQGRDFIRIARNESRRLKFANMMAQFVKKHNYDGIELDWEHTIDLDLHILFMADIRAALDALNLDKQLYLTTALHTTHLYTQEQADALSASVDWINIMSYDMGGGNWGDVPYHNTPLTTLKKVMEDWKVFDNSKVCIGLASYGFYYKDVAPSDTLRNGRKLDSYGRYCNALEVPVLMAEKGWVEKWDETEDAPYFFSPDGTEWITCDTPESLKLKMDWVKEEGYKGVFWWEFHTDWLVPATTKDRGTHLLMDGVTEYIKTNKMQ